MSISLAMPCYLGQAVEHLLIAGDMWTMVLVELQHAIVGIP
jgi:hypothetical protein